MGEGKREQVWDMRIKLRRMRSELEGSGSLESEHFLDRIYKLLERMRVVLSK